MQFRDDLRKLMRTTRKVLDKDLIDLQTETASKRRNWYSNIKEDKTQFENEFHDQYQDAMEGINEKKFIGEFDTALLFLHVASLEDSNAEPLDPAGFTDDEIQALRAFDKYRAFDVSDEVDLNERIKKKDEEIYQFVVQEVTEQKEQRGEIFESQFNDIRTSIMDYLGDEYAKREELSREAVGLYIAQHGLPDVVESIEEAVDTSLDAEETKQAIHNEVKELMEDFTGDIMASLHGQERSLMAEISGIQQEIETGDGELSQLESQIDSIGTKIEKLESSRRGEIDKLSSKIETLQTKRDQLDEKIDEIEQQHREAAREAVEVAEETSANKSSKLIQNALEDLEEEREKLQAEVDHLERQREQSDSGTERLKEEFENISDRIDSIESSVRADDDNGGVDAVQAADARLFELDYIGRIKSSLKNADSILLPDGDTFDIPRGYWSNGSHISVGDQRDQIEDLIENSNDISQYPLGRFIRGTLTDNGYLASSDKLVIEATVLCHLEAYAKNGFDTAAAGISDLLDTVNSTFERADEINVPHIIAVASPTGWTDEVVNKVQRANLSRARFGEDVSIYLIDLKNDEIYYDQADDVLVGNKDIIEREEKHERVSNCKRLLRSDLISPTTDSLLLQNVVDDSEYDASIVKETFESIAQTEEGELLTTEYGLAIDLT